MTKSILANLKKWLVETRKKNNVKKTLLGVLKELGLPAALAMLLWILGATSDTFKSIQQSFLGFFAIAWFTGQFVRINREIDRRDKTNNTISRLEDLAQSLQTLHEDSIGLATGKGSVPNISLTAYNNEVLILINNSSKYPLLDINVSLRYFSLDENPFDTFGTPDQTFKIDRINPQAQNRDFKLPSNWESARVFAEISHRSGYSYFECLYNGDHITNFVCATCTFHVGSKPIFASSWSDFPIDPSQPFSNFPLVELYCSAEKGEDTPCEQTQS